MQSKNDVILTARPRGCGALGGLRAKHCVGRLRWSLNLWWRAVFEVPRLQNLWDASVGEELPCEWKQKGPIRSSSDAKERHRRPCTQEDISCLLANSGRSAAFSL